MKPELDFEAFCAALDAHRLSRAMTWKQVAAESGVSASTLSRMSQGRRPDVDGWVALLEWSGLKREDFMRHAATLGEPETLARITVLLRADPKLDDRGRKAVEGVLRSAYQQFRNQ